MNDNIIKNGKGTDDEGKKGEEEKGSEGSRGKGLEKKMQH